MWCHGAWSVPFVVERELARCHRDASSAPMVGVCCTRKKGGGREARHRRTWLVPARKRNMLRAGRDCSACDRDPTRVSAATCGASLTNLKIAYYYILLRKPRLAWLRPAVQDPVARRVIGGREPRIQQRVEHDELARCGARRRRVVDADLPQLLQRLGDRRPAHDEMRWEMRVPEAS